MKRYIQQRSPMKLELGEKLVSPASAGRDFLKTILHTAAQQLSIQGEEIAFSVPVESFEYYDNWLTSISEECGFTRYRLIDEPTAAALGYGSHIQSGKTFIIFDFGGGTLHATVVIFEKDNKQPSGKRCRILGKAGKEIGGSTIDSWIYQEFLQQNGLKEWDDQTKSISNELLVECEKVKVNLSFSQSGEIAFENLDNGQKYALHLTSVTLDELFDRHNLIVNINHLLRTALNSARERGYQEDDISEVLMIGGSSQIPAIQRCLRNFFGKERVKTHRPFDAVAIGAAAFVSGMDFDDHIQHQYAIRYWNPLKGIRGDYDFKTIVERGAVYPSPEPIAKLTIKASNHAQKKLGISIYEIGSEIKKVPEAIELIFDPQGSPRLIQVTPEELEHRSMFWMNEENPTFLEASPPADPGQPRFEVLFSIDPNKQLIISAQDLLTQKWIIKERPVVKLS
jgi:molecular chaperone DnaK (HSP70)